MCATMWVWDLPAEDSLTSDMLKEGAIPETT